MWLCAWIGKATLRKILIPFSVHCILIYKTEKSRKEPIRFWNRAKYAIHLNRNEIKLEPKPKDLDLVFTCSYTQSLRNIQAATFFSHILFIPIFQIIFHNVYGIDAHFYMWNGIKSLLKLRMGCKIHLYQFNPGKNHSFFIIISKL